MIARMDGQGHYATSVRQATRVTNAKRCAIIRTVVMSKGVVRRMEAARVMWSMQARAVWSVGSDSMAGPAKRFAFGTRRALVKGSARETVHARASNGRWGNLARAVGAGTLVMSAARGAVHLRRATDGEGARWQGHASAMMAGQEHAASIAQEVLHQNIFKTRRCKRNRNPFSGTCAQRHAHARSHVRGQGDV